MKKWKDGKDRYGLHLNGEEVGVLYNDPLFGFYFTAFIGNGIQDIDIHSSTVAEAKKEVENRLVDLYEKHIAMLEESIRIHKQYIGLLNNTKKEG